MMSNTDKQTGFTLIELIVVIVILGILAATAMPKFLDLKNDALDSAASGVAGAMNSAFAVNYASSMAGKGGVAFSSNAVTAAAISNSIGSILVGGFPANYTVSAASCPGAGSSAVVSVSAPGSTGTHGTALATMICTG